MGFDIANNGLEETCFIVAVVGAALAILATVLRFVAVRKANRKPRWEDWSSVLALVFFILYVIPLLYLLRVMNGTEIAHLTKEQIVHIKKAGYSLRPQFCMQQLFAKLSLLFLYYRMFFISRPFVVCLYVLGGIQVAWSIATYLAHFLECTPPAKLWNPKLPGHCINSAAFLAAGETPNSLIDFALIALAVWMVQSLKLKTEVKIRLISIFIIGGLAGILGFVKIADGFGAVSHSKLELLDPIWASVQQTCSIICCCAPVYKPLIPDVGFLGMIRSLGSSVIGRSSKTSGTHPPGDGIGNGNGNGNATRKVSVVGGIFKHSSDDWMQLDEPHSLRKQNAAVLVQRGDRMC